MKRVITVVVLIAVAAIASAGEPPRSLLQYAGELALAYRQLTDSTATWWEIPEAEGSALRFTDTDGQPRVMIIGNPQSLDCWRDDTRSLSIQWRAPDTNSDGTPLTDLAGYQVQFVNWTGLTEAAAEGDTVYFDSWWPLTDSTETRVRAFDDAGNYSTWSNSLFVTPDTVVVRPASQ